MHILIEGGEFVNKGAEAMMRTVKNKMSQHFPNSSFYVERGSVVNGTEELVESAGFQILECKTPKRFVRLYKLANYIFQTPREAFFLWKHRRDIWKWEEILQKIDLAVDVSGYRYGNPGKSGRTGPRRIAPIIELAKRNNKPYIFLPQTWGPFQENTRIDDICRKNCIDSKLFFARDAVSRQQLANLLNKPLDDINLAPDITFCFEHAGKSVGQSRLLELGLNLAEQPIVCVAPNMRVYERSVGLGSENTYLKLLINICHNFIEQNVSVILIPHEFSPNPRSADDRWLCDIIRLAVGSDKSIAAVTQPTTTNELKAMISCCELLIGSRFHAIIAAIHSRVPAVTIGWAHKYAELMREVGLEKFVLDYQNLNTEEVIELINIAWKERKDNKQKLEKKLPFIEAAAEATFDNLAKNLSAV